MPKGNLNPAEAYRKAQRKKELKKNKAERTKNRDFALVKKDTTELEEEVKQLESSDGDKARLFELKTELENISKKKEEYVKEHPEQRNLVYRKRRKQEEDDVKPEAENPAPQKRNLFNKRGLPRHPERSIYYDPVLNPYGVPPPGMPYMERALQFDEVDSEAEDDGDTPLPKGLGPGYELVDSDDEISMPEGPPPTNADPHPPVHTHPLSTSVPLPPHTGFSVGDIPPSPFPSPVVDTLLPPPPPPPGLPPGTTFPPPLGAFQPGVPYPPQLPPRFVASLPPPPQGFFPRNQSISSTQDPLSSIPHTTYQAHRAYQNTLRSALPPNPSLPPKPTAVAELANATVIAAPQLRNLKKEVTAFVPNSLKRKRDPSSTGSSSKIDAAPSLGPAKATDENEDVKQGMTGPEARPDLVDMLRNQFGHGPTVTTPPTKVKTADAKKNDDYAKFMEEMSDIL